MRATCLGRPLEAQDSEARRPLQPFDLSGPWPGRGPTCTRRYRLHCTARSIISINRTLSVPACSAASDPVQVGAGCRSTFVLNAVLEPSANSTGSSQQVVQALDFPACSMLICPGEHHPTNCTGKGHEERRCRLDWLL